MEENITHDNASVITTDEDVMKVEMDEEPQKKEHWVKRHHSAIYLTIIGIFAFAWLGALEGWNKTELVLKRTTESLAWLAKEEHKPMREQLEFANKMLKDYNYYKFLKTVYESKDKNGLFDILTAVYEESLRANINPWETMSIINQESGFNPSAVSLIWKRDKNGNLEQVPCAYGLMQINYDAWKEEKGLTLKNIFDPRFNIRTGLEIYKYYLWVAKGDKFLALFYYNNGTAMPPEKQNHDYAPAIMNSKFMKMAVNYEPIELEKGARGISQ